MIYPPDAFIALVQEVEQQGGALLDDPCEKQDVVYKAPPYASPSVQEKITCGCEHQARLVSIYDTEGIAPGVGGGGGFATACAVCDNMGTWPRYCEAVYEVDPELNPAFYDEDEEEDAD